VLRKVAAQSLGLDWLLISALASDRPSVNDTAWPNYLRKLTPVLRVQLLKTVFESAQMMRHELLPNESAAVLHAIVYDGSVYIPNDLLDTTIPLSIRIDSIRSIRNVFVDLFIPFVETIARENRQVKNLAAECELWWERFPYRWSDDNSKSIFDAVVTEIEFTIGLRAKCVLESAIYGAMHIGDDNYDDAIRLLVLVEKNADSSDVLERVRKSRTHLDKLHGKQRGRLS
jgi:hypothetical protein